MPGDPGRALRLAQALLDSPRMFNHNRGLWGYTGTAADGEPLTIQSTGMGGPSAAIVVAELADLGGRRLLRIGTCGALDAALALGDLLLVTEALPEDGTSRALGASQALAPDPSLASALSKAGGESLRSGCVVSADLFYDAPEGSEEGWMRAGARAVDMETATLFALAGRRELSAASLLLVSDLVATRTRIAPEDLHSGEARLGSIALAALTATRTSAGGQPPRRS